MRSIGRFIADAPIKMKCVISDTVHAAEGALGTAGSCIIRLASSSAKEVQLLFGWLVGEHDSRTIGDMDPNPNGRLDTTEYDIKE